ncbi:MAG: hypothetical protein AAF533_26975 [Acidobacteriota bacterium]
MTHDSATALTRTLLAAGRKLRLRRAAEAALIALPWGLAAAALLVVASRLLPALRHAGLQGTPLLLAVLTLAIAPPVIAALLAGRKRFAPMELALLADRRLDSDERIATATWIGTQSDGESDAALEQEALALLEDREVDALFPWRRRLGPTPLLALVALVGATQLPLRELTTPEAPPPDETVAVVAEDLAEELEKLVEEMAEDEAPTEAREVLDELLEDAKDLAGTPTSREEAEDRLGRLEDALEEARARREATDSNALERSLGSLEQAALSRLGRRADEDEAATLAQQLQELAAELRSGIDFDQAEALRLSNRFFDAAEALMDGSHAELGEMLKRLAEALEAGDSEEAARILDELAASEALQEALKEMAGDDALADAEALLRQARAQLGEAQADERSQLEAVDLAEVLEAAAEIMEQEGMEGTPDQLREIAERVSSNRTTSAGRLAEELLASGELGEPTPSREASQAQAAAEAALRQLLGALSGEGGGQRPGPARDWGVGTTNEDTGTRAARNRGQQTDRESDETSSWREAYEALAESERLQDARGRSTKVSGQAGQGEHVTVPTWTSANSREEAQLPVVSLPASHAQALEQALSEETIAPRHRKSVERYFDQLAGRGVAPPSEDPKDD